MSDLDQAIAQCFELLPGEEFALFYVPDDDDDPEWRAEMVNRLVSVGLGEASGEYRGEGASALAAVEDLLRNIKSGVKRNARV